MMFKFILAAMIVVFFLPLLTVAGYGFLFACLYTLVRLENIVRMTIRRLR